MEIKIECPCGTKFKFDVEPVNGRMPMPVGCPSCGADRTELANEFLRQLEPPPPIAAVAAAPPQLQPGQLRIQRGPAALVPVAASLPVAPPPRPIVLPPASQGGSKLKQALTVAFAVVCVGLGIWRFGAKWWGRVRTVAAVAGAIGAASVGNTESDEPKNLTYEDAVVLFIRTSNHLDVATACKAYWRDSLHKNLTVTQSGQEAENPGEFDLIPAHNGYVRILGNREWPVPQFEGLALALSKQMNTLVFEMSSEHVADTYHFGAYDQGVRKFHAQMDIKMKGNDYDEIVTTEGNDWATANGYKPGPDGFKKFDLSDADKITQHVGMKLWDEKEGTQTAWLMKE